jgi:hypothetical protein
MATSTFPGWVLMWESQPLFSGSLSRGELDDYFTSPPSEEAMINALSVHSINGSLGFGLGFGKSYSAPPHPRPRGDWQTQ